jgi:hypothetical protein
MAPAGRLLFLPVSLRDPSAFTQLKQLMRESGARLSAVSAVPGADMWPVGGAGRERSEPAPRPIR